jgi:Ca2+-binding EF-hand superfamily protein
MKFATIALVSSAAAIKISAEAAKCHGNMDITNHVFDEIDTNHNGQINKEELTVAMEHFAKMMNHTITKEEAAWVTKTAYADAGKDKQLNKKEFNKFGNSFVNHFGLCKLAEEAVAKHSLAETQECHGPMAITNKVFKMIDTSHNGEIDKSELTAAVIFLAKEMNHKITKEEAAWVTKTAYDDAGKDKQLNPTEFNEFGNSFVNHFGLCAEAEEMIAKYSLAETQ